MAHISVIGAGAWGTALALAALRAGRSVTLLSLCDDKGVPFAPPHENIKYAKAIPNCPPLYITTIVAEAAERADSIIFVPPAQYMRPTCSLFQGLISAHVPLLIASKGIENTSKSLMSEVLKDVFPHNPILVLSGPSFAEEVSKDLPTAVSLAAESLDTSQAVAHLLTSLNFQLYACDDILGTQIGGAIKNIIAIACGIVEGRGRGENMRAAILARGLREVAWLGQKMGAKMETFLGLAGVGDITLTSLSSQSRNKSLGYALGKGTPLKEIIAGQHALTEGLHTVPAALALAQKYAISMPITEGLYGVLYKSTPIDTFLSTVLSEQMTL